MEHAIWCPVLTGCECGAAKRAAFSATRTVTLTADERKICGIFGITEAAYLRTKGQRSAGMTTMQRVEQIQREVAEERRLRGTHQTALSADERQICRTMGVSEADYVLSKARRQTGKPISINSAIDGRGIVEEAAAEHRQETNDDHATAEDFARSAIEALDAFMKEPGGDDNWRHLARASLMARVACERCAPAFASREPYGQAEAERRARVGRA